MIIRLLSSLAVLSLPTAIAGPPNLLFFLVDDMGWQETSVAFGPEETRLNRDYHTPNMEKLAERSVLFTDAYACAICSPTRVSLMTGQNAARHKVTCWTLRKNVSPERNHPHLASARWPLNGLQPPGSGIDRSTEARTLPDHLRELGYTTIHAGKAHFGAKDTPGADPRNLGFDVNIAGSYMGGPGSYHGDKSFSAVWRKGSPIWDVPGLEKYHGRKINLTEAITREAIAAVEKAVTEDRKPFYLYMSHYAVHAPWEPDRRFIDRYKGKKDYPGQKAVLASMLESMDRSLGDLLETLERLGVADETIVVFMSDNGAPKNCPRNLPLRGHKISGYEGGARVPLMVHLPGTSPGRCHVPVIIEDIFPTFLEWAGADEIPRNDGVSFADLVRAPQESRQARPLFWHYPNFYDQPPFSSVRLGPLKLIYWHVGQRFELFDLAADIGETTNLADQRSDDVTRLADLLSRHLRETGALMPHIKASGEPVPLPDEALLAAASSKPE